MGPHPDRDDQPWGRTSGRGKAAAVVGVIFLLLLVALHLAGAMSLHGS